MYSVLSSKNNRGFHLKRYKQRPLQSYHPHVFWVKPFSLLCHLFFYFVALLLSLVAALGMLYTKRWGQVLGIIMAVLYGLLGLVSLLPILLMSSRGICRLVESDSCKEGLNSGRRGTPTGCQCIISQGTARRSVVLPDECLSLLHEPLVADEKRAALVQFLRRNIQDGLGTV